MKKWIYLTESGLNELRRQYAELIAARSLIVDRVKSARELGDVAENAEYLSARQELERTEDRISEIENILACAKQIDLYSNAKNVGLGSLVTLCANNKERILQIVSTIEADPLNGKISDESPLGKKLLGKAAGDRIEVEAAHGAIIYTIIKIN